MMVWNSDTFALAIANIHARAVRSRHRDQVGVDVLLGFAGTPAAPVTIVGMSGGGIDTVSDDVTAARQRHPSACRHIPTHSLRALPPPEGMTLLPGPITAHRETVLSLVRDNDVSAICYTCGQPDARGRLVRTVGVWPGEMVAVTHLTDVVTGVKVDPEQDATSVVWEDWVARLIPISPAAVTGKGLEVEVDSDEG